MNHVYIFYWNDCIYESVPAPVSLHHTAKGAYQAMRSFLLSEYAEHVKRRSESDRYHQKGTYLKFGWGKSWLIRKEEILP